VDADVAVLDSGIRTDQPDLNVVGGVNCSLDPGGFDDQDGHGTAIAGAIGALDNSYGVVGAAPGVRLWSVKVLDRNSFGELSNVVCGADWVTAHADTIDVAALGFDDLGADDGNCGYTNGDLFHQAVCRMVAAGVTVVVAAGNTAQDVSGWIPGAYPEVIAVSWYSDLDGLPGALSSKRCDNFSSDDTLDPDSNFGAGIDIAGPGDCIRTTGLKGSYVTYSSNSLSSGYVAAAGALYLTNHHGASPAAVKNALLRLAEPGPLTGDPDSFHEGLVSISKL
jgi:subtilisin family serine protease